jgi:hypothetical protein
MDKDKRLPGHPNKLKHDWRDWLGVRGKTAWDWLALLIVPLFIVVATVVATAVLNYFENQRENQRADALLKAENQRALAQQQIEDDRVRHTVLQSYIQHMTELLLDKRLATSEFQYPVREIARASTLTAVRQLDAGRKGILLQFLHESDPITEQIRLESNQIIDPVISLRGADLSGANLSGVNLGGADLGGANLSGANLSGAPLGYVLLENTNLRGANLSGIGLWGANLSGANLRDANLSGATLYAVNLSGTKLWEANLNGG